MIWASLVAQMVKNLLAGVLFLLPSDVYVRSFLYPFYTFFSIYFY